ncbi:MAG: hypothetical protein Q7V31_00635 [Parvibaculum sp.]|uniref:PstS family phosphate ABC transporter substrate-binding protein n=1 Tax=Parvibaculum sp. TaxID=2024848 RepID=UPI00272869DB|nr:hypothetical protein [Parvibaculum sp.]MDO8837403.1 hypothetical protein [Parvibaculum sp.]
MKHLATFVGLLSLVAAGDACAVDERYAPYVAPPALGGVVEVAVEPANERLMLLWREGFAARHPAVRIEPLDAATSDALTARAAVEALAVFVHKDNPLVCLPLENLGPLFAGNAAWGAAGLDGDWASRPVILFDRPPGGERSFFVAAALKGGAIAPDAKRVARASVLLREIGRTPGAISFAPVGYRSDAVRVLRLSDGGDCVGLSEANAHRGHWPLARILRIVARGPAARNMIDYVLSQDGQRDVAIAGYFALPHVFASEDRKALGLD